MLAAAAPADRHGLDAPRQDPAVAVPALGNVAPTAPRPTDLPSCWANSPTAITHLHATEHPSPTDISDARRDTVRRRGSSREIRPIPTHSEGQRSSDDNPGQLTDDFDCASID